MIKKDVQLGFDVKTSKKKTEKGKGHANDDVAVDHEEKHSSPA